MTRNHRKTSPSSTIPTQSHGTSSILSSDPVFGASSFNLMYDDVGCWFTFALNRTVLFILFLFLMMIVGLIYNNHCYSVIPMDDWDVCERQLHIMYWGLVGLCSSIKFAILYVEWRRDQRLAQESADERVWRCLAKDSIPAVAGLIRSMYYFHSSFCPSLPGVLWAVMAASSRNGILCWMMYPSCLEVAVRCLSHVILRPLILHMTLLHRFPWQHRRQLPRTVKMRDKTAGPIFGLCLGILMYSHRHPY